MSAVLDYGTASRPSLLVIVASTRPGRSGPLVAEWFTAVAEQEGGFDVQVADLAEIALPLLDEPEHPRFGNYHRAHTQRWSAMVRDADAFVIVTPEYDHAPPASLINALQYLAQEWAYKPAALVSYGGISGGLRGVQMTRLILNTLRMMVIPEAVVLPFFGKQIDVDTGAFAPGEDTAQVAEAMLHELRRWTEALAPLRAPQPA